MIEAFPPGFILIAGAFVSLAVPARLRGAFMLILPIIGFWQLTQLETGLYGHVEMFGHTMTLLRVDKLSLIFGYVFFIAAELAIIYALHVKDPVQQVAGLAYAGAAVGAVFAGDLISLFVFWELTAITSVFLIWAVRTDRAMTIGTRYLLIQVGSGVLLLTGALVLIHETGSVAFGHIGIESLGGQLILVAFGIKAAFPFLHNWLQDSYPEATETGTVFLSAFTTKLAIYALARGYAGTEMLIWIGATMTAFPVFFAVIENNLRRVLAYSLNNQLGFMVVGIGIGTELSINGAAAHAFAHIIYKSLLFMSMGAVLYRVGTVKASELGGLYKSMPWTTVFCIIGAASISGFPLLSGFVTKSMILTAASDGGHWITWTVLLFASAGVMEHSGIKIPFFAFFGHDQGHKVREAPVNMLIAMGLASSLCIFIGVFPAPLYALLPYSVDYTPYTTAHVITMLQLLAFAALAFAVLMRTGLYPDETPSTNLDTDWIYRRLAPRLVASFGKSLAEFWEELARWGQMGVGFILDRAFQYHGPNSWLARTWPIGGSAFCVLILLGGYLIVYFI